VEPHERVRVNRLIFIAFLILSCSALIGNGAAFVRYTIWKVPPEQVQLELARSGLYSAQDPRRDVTCDHAGSTTGWDYICTFVPNPSVSPKRAKFGVRMALGKIQGVSPMRELDARYILP
jgi:hypothetical protein